MTWLSKKNIAYENRIQNLQERLQPKSGMATKTVFTRPRTGQPGRAMRDSRRHIRINSDAREFALTQDRSNKLFSEADNRSMNNHTVRTETASRDVIQGRTKSLHRLKDQAKRATI